MKTVRMSVCIPGPELVREPMQPKWWNHNIRQQGVGLVCLLLALIVIGHDAAMATLPYGQPAPVLTSASTPSIHSSSHLKDVRLGNPEVGTELPENGPCHDPACPSLADCGFARIVAPTTVTSVPDATTLGSGDNRQLASKSVCQPETTKPRSFLGRDLLVQHQVFII